MRRIALMICDRNSYTAKSGCATSGAPMALFGIQLHQNPDA
jgi:hypothetical protein